jgi:hypothetical protein
MSNLRQAKICVEKLTPNDNRKLQVSRKQSNSRQHMQKLRAAFLTDKLWPAGSKLRIGFVYSNTKATRNKAVHWTPLNTLKESGKPLDPLEETVRAMDPELAVRTVVRDRIMKLVGLDIEFVENAGDANIRVAFNDDGAWAYVGIDALQYKYPEPTVNFGWLDVGTIIHEFGHVLGMIHEHQNPKGGGIPWNKTKVYEWAEETQGWNPKTTETNILDRYDISQINGSTFDPLSIMLYFFPAELTTTGNGTEQNLRLSGIDVEYINQIYEKGSPETPEVFYKEVYGITLKQALQESINARKKFDSNTNGVVKTSSKFFNIPKQYLFNLAILISMILIGWFVWYMYNKSPNKHIYQGNNRSLYPEGYGGRYGINR